MKSQIGCCAVPCRVPRTPSRVSIHRRDPQARCCFILMTLGQPDFRASERTIKPTVEPMSQNASCPGMERDNVGRGGFEAHLLAHPTTFWPNFPSNASNANLRNSSGVGARGLKVGVQGGGKAAQNASIGQP